MSDQIIIDDFITVPKDLDTPIHSKAPNFKWKEVFRSATADEHGISNLTNDQVHLRNIVETAIKMQSIKDTVFDGACINVSSWYRNPDVNKLVGGSPTSDHAIGAAVDFNVVGHTPEEVYCKIAASDIPFNQLIQEFSQWTHYAYHWKDGNRNSPMRFTKDKNNKTIKNYEDRKKYQQKKQA